MCMENRVDVYGDCAVNPDLNEEQLADIAISSAETAAAFGIEPRGDAVVLHRRVGQGVPMSTRCGPPPRSSRSAPEPASRVRSSSTWPSTRRWATRRCRARRWPARATVFIFPDLNTGNNTYKAVQRSAGALAVGPVLQGLNKPVNDLVPRALVDDIVNTIAITAIQAQQ